MGAGLLQAEAQEYIATCDCPEYLRKAEKRLTEETDRVAHYLDSSSEPKIARVVEAELVGKQVRGFRICQTCRKRI
jgi:cullin 3